MTIFTNFSPVELAIFGFIALNIGIAGAYLVGQAIKKLARQG